MKSKKEKIEMIKTLANGRYKTTTASLVDPTVEPHRVGMYAEVVNLSVLNNKQYCVAVDVVDGHMNLLLNSDSRFASNMNEGDILGAKHLSGGFDVSDLEGRRVVCLAGGSGIGGIIPVIRHVLKHTTSQIDVIYIESEADHNVSPDFWELSDSRAKLHFGATQGVLSTNEHTPILGMLTNLTGCQPILFMNKPVYFACGPKGFVNRLKDALVPIYAEENDFRLNF